MSTAQQQAQDAAGRAKSRVRDQLDERSSQAAEQIKQQAADLRAVSSSLREQDKGALPVPPTGWPITRRRWADT